MDKDDIADHIRGWLEHPHTRALKREHADYVSNAFQHLNNACIVSTDPDVRAAYAEWFGTLKVAKMLEKGFPHDS